MKAVLISIQPKWCELIANGKKTIEVRKTKPKLETPFKVYIYCTKGETIYLPRDIFGNNALNGKVIGEFVCNDITVAGYGTYCDIPTKKSQIDILDYLEHADGKTVYGWHISDLVIYDTPKEIWEFATICERLGSRCMNCDFLCTENNESTGLHQECVTNYLKPLKDRHRVGAMLKDWGEDNADCNF